MDFKAPDERHNMIENITEIWTWTTQNSIWVALTAPLLILFVTPAMMLLVQRGGLDPYEGRIIIFKDTASQARNKASIATGIVGLLLVGITAWMGIHNWVVTEGMTDHKADASYIKVVDLTINSGDVSARTFLGDRPKELWLKTDEYPDLSIHVSGETGVSRLIDSHGAKTGVLYCTQDNPEILDCKADKTFNQDKPSDVGEDAKHTVKTTDYTG